MIYPKELVSNNQQKVIPTVIQPTVQQTNINKISPTITNIQPSITSTPIPTKIVYPSNTPAPQVPTTQENTSSGIQTNTSSGYVCNCGKTCTQITTCDEAYFQLNNCGCRQRDGDKDGVPCENLCK